MGKKEAELAISLLSDKNLAANLTEAIEELGRLERMELPTAITLAVIKLIEDEVVRRNDDGA